MATPKVYKLPSLKDLYDDKNMASAQNDLNKILNAEPRKEWLENHPYAKRKVKAQDGSIIEVPCQYLTVQRVEYLLTEIFIQWNLEIKEVKLVANSIMAIVRLHYKNPVNSEWYWQDGVGAAPIQTDSGTGSTNTATIKTNAVQIGAPAAEVFAFKDAAEKIGKLFGKDINRADQIFYTSIYTKFSSGTDEISPHREAANKAMGNAESLLNSLPQIPKR